MTGQGFLFDPYNGYRPQAKRAAAADPQPIAAPAEDVPRLTGQNGAILKRLRLGAATNVELSQISLKYTSRISDIRKHLDRYFPGQTITCRRHKSGNGVTIYQINGGAE